MLAPTRPATRPVARPDGGAPPSADAPATSEVVVPEDRRVGRLGRALAVMAIAAAGLVWVTMPRAAASRDLVLRTADQLAVVDTATGEAVLALPGAVVSPDGSGLVATVDTPVGPELRGMDASTGAVRWRRTVGVGLVPALVAGDGETVVLTAGTAGSDPYVPVAREYTRLAVSRPDGMTLDLMLEGNFAPEAFSTDLRSVFVISYLPPTAPTSYQVRRLDLSSGQVVDVFSVDAELQQAMGGTARKQAWSPDGTRLYTLYSLAPDAGGEGHRAFVHVLDLEELWAHCVDLPSSFTLTDEAASALAVSPDGRRLVVADQTTRAVITVDTDTLLPTGTARLPHPAAGSGSAAILPSGEILLASSSRIDRLSADLEHLDTWYAGGPVAGLVASGRSDELLAVLGDGRLMFFDVRTGDRRRVVESTVTGDVESVGGMPVAPPTGSKDVLTCAC